ncbi:MAG TPA: SufE family protein [Candidatus Poseidoniales archaeon]|jgi:cysteine desulfuration protein SufE|nr:MAG: SufE family protein [Euryarchaeota archaeon]DAC38714.1 MAG TPA: SufE family protein [Candidatus Poseidoniales archaeon]HIH57934.1 SufE family protein [Candidatus Poseidoniaceae archaeon]|tara:strand:- start:119 stop:532 length:414 start_codon:yes stop_codon:yes gene_type:complete
MNWPDSIQEIIEEFQEIEDQFERLEVLMDFAEEVDELPVEEWNDSNLVRGCQSVAHIEVSIRDELVWLRAAADAKMVQGLQGILSIAVNGASPEIVLQLTPDFAEEAGILVSLTPSRSNGFRTMFDMVQNRVKEAIL